MLDIRQEKEVDWELDKAYSNLLGLRIGLLIFGSN